MKIETGMGFPRTYETRGFTLVSRIGEEAHSTRRLLEIGNSSGRLFPVLCGTCFTAASGPNAIEMTSATS